FYIQNQKIGQMKSKKLFPSVRFIIEPILTKSINVHNQKDRLQVEYSNITVQFILNNLSLFF
ncbi:hypothetical protein CD170_08200, partial [Staphylococcus aureus]